MKKHHKHIRRLRYIVVAQSILLSMLISFVAYVVYYSNHAVVTLMPSTQSSAHVELPTAGPNPQTVITPPYSSKVKPLLFQQI